MSTSRTLALWLALLSIGCGDETPPEVIVDTRTPEEIVPALGELRSGIETARAHIAPLAWPADLAALPRCATRLSPAERSDVVVIDLALHDALADTSPTPLLDRLTPRAAPSNQLLDALAMEERTAQVLAQADAEPTPALADWTRSSGLILLQAPAERALVGVQALSLASHIGLARASTFVAPMATTGETFVGGRYDGDVVVFDVASREALCTIGVSVESSDSVPTDMRGLPAWSPLTIDLVDRALEAARRDLAAGVDVPSTVPERAPSRPRTRRPSPSAAGPRPPPR
jgi:hypothetical protein